MTVCEVCADLIRHPVRHLIRQWHWKGAAFGAILRGSIFFATNLADGVDVAIRATLVDSMFRVPLVGALAAATQAFLFAEPQWAASFAAMALLPALAHAIEFLVHWNAGTPELGMSMIASIAFSAVSAIFNLFAMRRGVLIVGGASRPFSDDLRRLPGVAADFVLALPRALAASADRTTKRRSCR